MMMKDITDNDLPMCLEVDKNNQAAIKLYEKFGFQWIDSVQTDIGNDFIMDDYILEYRLGTFL